MHNTCIYVFGRGTAAAAAEYDNANPTKTNSIQ